MARRTDASLSTHYLFGDDGRRGDLHPMRKSPLPYSIHPPYTQHPPCGVALLDRPTLFPQNFGSQHSCVLIFISLFLSAQEEIIFFFCYFQITIRNLFSFSIKRLQFENRKSHDGREFNFTNQTRVGLSVCVVFPGTYAMIDFCRGCACAYILFQREIQSLCHCSPIRRARQLNCRIYAI